MERILQEEEPEKTLHRLDDLAVLAAIHPDLRAAPQLGAQFENLRQRLASGDPLAQAAVADEPLARLYWGLLVYPLLPATDPPEGDDAPENRDAQEADDSLITRLMLRGETRTLMRKLRFLKAHRAELSDPSEPPSRLTAILDRATQATIFLLSLVEDDPQLHVHLQRYYTEWQHIRPSIDGGELRRMGIRPGPLYGVILRRLRAGPARCRNRARRGGAAAGGGVARRVRANEI